MNQKFIDGFEKQAGMAEAGAALYRGGSKLLSIGGKASKSTGRALSAPFRAAGELGSKAYGGIKSFGKGFQGAAQESKNLSRRGAVTAKLESAGAGSKGEGVIHAGTPPTVDPNQAFIERSAKLKARQAAPAPTAQPARPAQTFIGPKAGAPSAITRGVQGAGVSMARKGQEMVANKTLGGGALKSVGGFVAKNPRTSMGLAGAGVAGAGYAAAPSRGQQQQ